MRTCGASGRRAVSGQGYEHRSRGPASDFLLPLARRTAARRPSDAPLAARWRGAGLSIIGPHQYAGICRRIRDGADVARVDAKSLGFEPQLPAARAAVRRRRSPPAWCPSRTARIREARSVCLRPRAASWDSSPAAAGCPVGPHHDEFAGGLDCEHVLTRSVRDSAVHARLDAGRGIGLALSVWRVPPTAFAGGNGRGAAALAHRDGPARARRHCRRSRRSAPQWRSAAAALERAGPHGRRL